MSKKKRLRRPYLLVPKNLRDRYVGPFHKMVSDTEGKFCISNPAGFSNRLFTLLMNVFPRIREDSGQAQEFQTVDTFLDVFGFGFIGLPCLISRQ